MPEIAEIARVVHFLRKHLVGKKIAKVQAPDDASIFGKVGTSGPAFEAALKGKKVVSAGTQGKYFWLILDSPPHPVMHFGMTGWIHIKGDKTADSSYYKRTKPEDVEAWPPKFWKFQLETEGNPKVEVAFTDPRRFGRIRLVDCQGAEIRKNSPLVENGPDPVIDLDVFTEEYLRKKMQSRHVPIKALILDQAVISGIGNWVGDEVMYHAKLHPEQYCDEFNDKQIKQLFESIRYVCQTAVDKLGDADEFPGDWLFKHRWGKGTKGGSTSLPNGEKLAFITVGGRTSCYAPNIQKKTGHVPPGIKEEPLEAAETGSKLTKSKKAKKEVEEDVKPAKSRKNKNMEPETDDEQPSKKPRTQKGTTKAVAKAEPSKKAKNEKMVNSTPDTGRRRSGRLAR